MDNSIYRGVLTGCNDAFIIDESTRQSLIAEDPKSIDLLKPVLRGRDIRRYQAQWDELWLIDTHNGYSDVLPIDVRKYPAIKRHLDYFYPKLEKRQDKGVTPYNLRNCAYHAEFTKEKLFWPDMARTGRFAYSNEESYCNSKGYIMTGISIKYLCAILNSPAITWLMQNTAATTGMGLTEWTVVAVKRIPIPLTSMVQQTPLIKIVEDIIQTRATYPTKDISQQEAQINSCIYKLYGFTKKEIKIIEKS